MQFTNCRQTDKNYS